MRRQVLASLVIVVVSACGSVGSRVEKQCYHANEVVEEDTGYCQAVRVDNTLYIAGTAGQGEMGSAMRSV